MIGPTADDSVADSFAEHRGRLMAVAYRMLGSRADAEDAVQETWLRLAGQDPTSINNLAGWLTTVVGRVCIDVLRARKARPEDPLGDRLPDVMVMEDDDGPDDGVLRAESIGLALLVVLDTLRPTERLAFVLHDMFAVPFEEIGRIIDRSADATKMLASRARRKVRDTPRPNGDRRQQRAVVDAFLAAAREGDFEGLLRVLDPELSWRIYTPRGVQLRHGANEVAARAQLGLRAQVTARRVLVNGEPGIVAWAANGRPLGVMACTVVDDRIVNIISLASTERLATLNLPGSPG